MLSTVMAAMGAAISGSAMDVTIGGLGSEPAQAGKAMVWSGSSTSAGNLRYRFRARQVGSDYRMIRDYGPAASLSWAADREGSYEMEVSAKNLDTAETATVSQVFPVQSRVAGGHAAVNSTENPLVFVFSAPACGAGGRMRIEYQASGGPVQQTPFHNCTPAFSMNFYLAGLYPETSYTARSVLDTGTAINTSEPLSFQTGKIPEFNWGQTVLKAYPTNVSQPVLLASAGGSQVAFDLHGKVLWFNPNPQSYATRLEAGGFLWGFLEDNSKPVEQQAIRKVNLVGRTILETNAERVNEQLAARGKRRITGFHHEVRTLPDGRIAALASVEQLLTDVQGPGTVDVLGDMIIVFDQNLQVVWTWDTFDWLDVTRVAPMGDTCAPGGGGCAPFHLAATANDWTHGNSLQQTPDGNLLYSCRHQDWLIKIAYGNGEGDGHVIWRLGRDGDFTYGGEEEYPWFSHQHDANFESATRIVVFDNGNSRIIESGGFGNSRGQVIELDEEHRTATLVLNADLGVQSTAVGSAQRLKDGNYHFDAGYVPAATGLTAYAFEVDAAGRIVGAMEANALVYRSFRVTDLYGAN